MGGRMRRPTRGPVTPAARVRQFVERTGKGVLLRIGHPLERSETLNDLLIPALCRFSGSPVSSVILV